MVQNSGVIRDPRRAVISSKRVHKRSKKCYELLQLKWKEGNFRI
jgi:hypothetical protein